MNRSRFALLALVFALALVAAGCGRTYKAKPLSFKAPEAYANATEVAGATIAAVAFDDPEKAREAFGFDVLAAGLLPVQVIFDNPGGQALKIEDAQTFLQDAEGNLWPILDEETAYDRATKYAETKEIFKQGAYSGFLGATAGALVGAAVGIVSGDSVARAAGQGAAVGAAAGATLGGASKVGGGEARRRIIRDLRKKSLDNHAVPARGLSFGFLFFPAEAQNARSLRLRLKEADTQNTHLLVFPLR
ncbi:MAG: hypothetical protein JRI97_12145 [Deltaproteobacteria bacterium]|nr:hypothetical protein [Deltaproteobacteria bacterium]